MNISEKLIIKLKEYLNNSNNSYYDDSFDFKGLRENVPQLDGTFRSLYVVSYLVSISDTFYDSDATYFAYFEETSKKLLYIIGPQSYEKIEE